MTVDNLAWAVVLLPLGALLASYVVESPRRAAWVCVAGSGAAFAVAMVVLVARAGHISDSAYQATITFWTYVPGAQPNGTSLDYLNPQVGILVDGISAVLLPTVALVATVVQAYTVHYLRSDVHLRRFEVTASFFAFALLAFVASPNLFQSYMMWEAVGIASLVLVGHWWHRDSVAAGVRRMAVITRVGDLLLLLGIVIAYVKLAPDAQVLPHDPQEPFNDPFNFNLVGVEAQRLVNGVVLGSGTRTLVIIACLVLAGALVRGSQLPFSSWLPAVSAGPTPALALVVSVGMAGTAVVLLARLHAVLEYAPHVLTAAALVGVATALYAGVCALGQTDVKRCLTYLSMAHTGLMVAAIGVGAVGAAVVHLVSHAWFMTALLLGFGNVIAAYGTQDLREMGGVRERMPRTAMLLLVASLSSGLLALLAGFWSGDAILAGALRDTFANGGANRGVVRDLAVAGVVAATALIAAASLRPWLLAAPGTPARRRGFVADRIREAPRLLLVPTGIATGLAAVGGLVAIEGPRFSAERLLASGTGLQAPGFSGGAFLVTLLAGVAGAGAALAWRRRPLPVPPLAVAAARTGLWLDAGLTAAASRMVALAGPVPRLADEYVLTPVEEAAADAVGLLGEGTRRAGSSRLAVQLAGGVGAVVVLVGAVTLAATGHLFGVGAAR